MGVGSIDDDRRTRASRGLLTLAGINRGDLGMARRPRTCHLPRCTRCLAYRYLATQIIVQTCPKTVQRTPLTVKPSLPKPPSHLYLPLSSTTHIHPRPYSNLVLVIILIKNPEIDRVRARQAEEGGHGIYFRSLSPGRRKQVVERGRQRVEVGCSCSTIDA